MRALLPRLHGSIQEPDFTHPEPVEEWRLAGARAHDLFGPDDGTGAWCALADRWVRIEPGDGPDGGGRPALAGVPHPVLRAARTGDAAWWAPSAERVVCVGPGGGPEAAGPGPALPACGATAGLFPDGAGGAWCADADGGLWRARPGEPAFRRVGNAPLAPVRAAAGLADGRLYGLCGEGVGHFFRMDPGGACAPLGAVATALGARRYAFDFSCAVAGPDGFLFFGERDRGAHLWVYFPPQRA